MPGYAHREGGARAGDPLAVTRKGREKSRGLWSLFSEPYPRRREERPLIGAPTYVPWARSRSRFRSRRLTRASRRLTRADTPAPRLALAMPLLVPPPPCCASSRLQTSALR
eukprot:6721732-Prymnesium_polylepis.1